MIFYLTNIFSTKVQHYLKWNFTKFLIDATGVPVKRYAPIIPPSMIAKDIARELHI
jgi:glutathione peroxidase-family protein